MTLQTLSTNSLSFNLFPATIKGSQTKRLPRSGQDFVIRELLNSFNVLR